MQRAAMFALLVALCGCDDPRPRQADWPEGLLLVGRRAALAELTQQLGILGETPLASTSRALADALPDCETVEAFVSEGSVPDLPRALRCGTAEGELAAVHAARAGSDLVFATPTRGGVRWLGRMRVAQGNVALKLARTGNANDGALSLFLPGGNPVAPTRLGAAGRIVHVRVRPNDLDLAALIPERGQADQLFRLRSALFRSGVLDGTWELAVYAPETGRPTPGVALALGVRWPAPAVAAAEGFIDELRASWPVTRSAFSAGPHSGACLRDLKILPDFAPCYVATEEALIVGWNASSVNAALAGAAPNTETNTAAARMVIELARVRETDLQLARLSPEVGAQAALPWPWQRVVGSGRRIGEELRFQLNFQGRSTP